MARLVGSGISLIALSFSSVVCTPVAFILCPRNFTSSTPKWHFDLFKRSPAFINLLKTASRRSRCSVFVLPLIITSSR
uniref:Putative secreted protein n=1 Tax=Ixodes ricinus TaxID=34613 RepID=A0A6B0TUM8_IXORI